MELVKEGKTVESVISLIMEELKCERADLDIEILQEPVKGIFGLTKMAKVKAVLRKESDLALGAHAGTEIKALNEDQKSIKVALEKILELMGIQYDSIKVTQEGEYVVFEIKSDAEGLIIGHHGKNIESIQYLINKIINQKDKEKIRFFIDIGGYLNKHKQSLDKIADLAVSKAMESKEEVKLEPMNAYDRRIIHLHLKDNTLVQTNSQGEGSNRYVVISLKP
jgi:spoIIIJ-associated protein